MRPAREWIKSLGLAVMAVVVQRSAVSAAEMNVATSGVLRLTGGVHRLGVALPRAMAASPDCASVPGV